MPLWLYDTLTLNKEVFVMLSKLRNLILTVILFSLSLDPCLAGSLEPSGSPSEDTTRMYTLEQIYDVAAGHKPVWPDKPSEGFNEPTSGPAPTMRTLDNIQSVIAAGVTTATDGDILAGKTAITRDPAKPGETLITGSITTQTLSADDDTVDAGYYAATTLSTVDPYLATANIKSGITIFGFAGDLNVMDTSLGTATASDMLSGTIAYVAGNEITGTATAGNHVEGDQGLKTFTIPDGLYSGSKTATAVDDNLIEGNIKDQVTIFGVTGNYGGGGGAYGLPKTTQTSVYHAASGDDLGDDASVSAGWPGKGQAETGRWSLVAYGGQNIMVQDKATGLIWQRRGDMPSSTNNSESGGSTQSSCLWEAAFDYVESLNADSYGGRTDWRLPNIKELMSIVNYQFFNPATYTEANGTGYFTATQSDLYWSSTTYAGFTGLAWYVDFYGGDVNVGDKTSVTYYVRAVRGGQ